MLRLVLLQHLFVCPAALAAYRNFPLRNDGVLRTHAGCLQELPLEKRWSVADTRGIAHSRFELQLESHVMCCRAEPGEWRGRPQRAQRGRRSQRAHKRRRLDAHRPFLPAWCVLV